MFDTPGDDEELAFVELDVTIPQLDGHLTLYDKKQLVFMFVSMPDELSLKFHQLYVVAIQLANDLWTPEIGEQFKLFLKIDFLHF